MARGVVSPWRSTGVDLDSVVRALTGKDAAHDGAAVDEVDLVLPLDLGEEDPGQQGHAAEPEDPAQGGANGDGHEDALRRDRSGRLAHEVGELGSFGLSLGRALRQHGIARVRPALPGLLADSQTQDAYFQPFLEGTAPERSFTDQSTSEQSRQAARDDIF